MKSAGRHRARRATILVLIVGLLTMLFMVVSAYITLARFDRLTARLTSQGDTTAQVVQSLSDVLAGIVSRPADGDPAATLMGVNYALIPGAPGARWLAALDPVRDPNAIPSGSGYKPDDFFYPAVTSLSGASVTRRRIGSLMFGDPNTIGEINPYLPYSDPNRYTILNARQPFMDADGDGIADADFRGAALGTELANAVVGRAVTVDPNQPFEPNVWAFFDAQARYEVAVRIISHGGMVLLDNPGDQLAWNTRFLTHMFNALRQPNDQDTLDPDDVAHRSLLSWVGSERAANEPALRHRGGLLTSLRTARTSNLSALAPSLRTLGQWFPNTVYPTWPTSEKPNTYERFNLGVGFGAEWRVWYQAASLDADEYNRNVGTPSDPRYRYVPRRLLTTVNNSDELARKQQRDPNVDNGLTLGIRAGQLKFYLGRIQNAFPNGYYDPVLGGAIVRELAGYYAEMLSGYTGWRPGGLWGHYIPGIRSEPVSLREQALMLAVNTVAFAAPRDANGYIAPVWYDDTETVPGPLPVYVTKRYYGYLPQPHITQVVASYGSDATDPNDPNVPGLGLALAVELYNPHDSLWWQTPDTHALDLNQFALTVDVVAGQPVGYTGLIPLAGSHLRNPSGPCASGRLPGRTFMAIGIPYEGADGHHDPFGSLYVDASVPGRALSYHDGESIEVRLWRRHAEAGADIWYMVDRMYLDSSSLAGAGVDPNSAWYANIERDTGYEPYFGQYTGGSYSDLRPRWRTIAAFPPNSQNKTVISGDTVPTSVLAQLRQPVPEGSLYFHFGPCTPMYTMNAGAGAYTLHGAPRPASFPTVGFLLFVPRFSHVCKPAVQAYKCMGEVLYEQWDLRGGSDVVVAAPADLGHMPVFDNTQLVSGDSSFSSESLGRVPWGLLVYDYFTTLSPNGPDGQAGTTDDVDPYRVPGRINVNVAPWPVLANLPAFSPAVLPNWGSPAFYRADSGVLAGAGLDGTPRSALHRFDPNGAVNGQWYRLGARLAQAAASYRDRIQYAAETLPAPWSKAWLRGIDPNSADGTAEYRPTAIYEFIRGAGPNPLSGQKYGFLTLGELANVVGFDGSTDAELATGPLTTALGRGDFMRAVSALALLDTHFLTTRTNTFTVYASVTDREKPQSSARVQFTLDRSRLLPRIEWLDLNQNGIRDAEPTDRYELIYGVGMPEFIGQRKTAYFNTRYDE